MGCHKCQHYSYKLTKCQIGKANPRTRRNTYEVSKLMGWSYICLHNKWKQQAIREMDEVPDGTPYEPTV